MSRREDCLVKNNRKMKKDTDKLDDWVNDAFCSGLLKTCGIIIATIIIVAIAVKILECIVM